MSQHNYNWNPTEFNGMFYQQPDGFQENNKTNQVVKLSSKMILTEDLVRNNDYIYETREHLIHELVQEIITRKLFRERMTKQSDFISGFLKHELRIDIDVLPINDNYPNVTTLMSKQLEFKVKDELFTNEELIQAVKECFPERLI